MILKIYIDRLFDFFDVVSREDASFAVERTEPPTVIVLLDNSNDLTRRKS